MKKMSVKKEILTIALIIVGFLAIGSQVLATGTSDSPIQIPAINTTTNVVDTNTTVNEVTTVNVVTPTTNVVTPTTNTTGSTYENTTLPQTGDASDYAIFMLILVAAVIAVYAYKKVREYNV